MINPRSVLSIGARLLFLSALLPSVAMAQQPIVKVPPRPTPGPAAVFAFPKVVTQTLANGLRLAIVENHDLPIIAVRVGFSGGTFLDAPRKEGGWSLMLLALREGTTTRSGSSIAEAAADFGTNIVWSPFNPVLGAPSFTTVRAAFQPMLELVADMLVNPSFPADAVRRLQTAQATSAARLPQAAIATRIFSAQLYGADHPYARYSTDSSIRSVTRDDLVKLQTTYLRPQNTFVVVAGDITAPEARAAVEKAFLSWERGGTTVESDILAPKAHLTQTTIFLRDQPNVAQSLIAGGQLVPSHGAVDAPAIEALGAIIGGESGGGRMWQAFRVDHGLSYTPATLIEWRPEPQVATWRGQATVLPANTDTAVVEWLGLLRGAHGEHPLTTTELEFSRRNVVGGLLTQLETVGQVATGTLTILRNRLSTSFYNDYVARVNSLTLAEVQAAATKYLDPDHTVIVVVGDRAKIEAPLRATGIPVVLIDH
jgi:predicted Zn-dependent peptidase